MDHSKPTAKDLSSHSPALWKYLSSAKLGAFQGLIKAATPLQGRWRSHGKKDNLLVFLLQIPLWIKFFFLWLFICRSIPISCVFIPSLLLLIFFCFYSQLFLIVTGNIWTVHSSHQFPLPREPYGDTQQITLFCSLNFGWKLGLKEERK